MTKVQTAAYVHAQAVAATAEIEGMKVQNEEDRNAGRPLSFDMGAFQRILDTYNLHHNSLICIFTNTED